MEKIPTCWLPFGNSSEILVLWTQENRSVGNPSVCLGNLAMPSCLCLEEVAKFVGLDG